MAKLAGMVGTGGAPLGGTGAETGLELVEEEPKDVRGLEEEEVAEEAEEEEWWGGGRDDWSREIRRMERRRDPSPEEV